MLPSPPFEYEKSISPYPKPPYTKVQHMNQKSKFLHLHNSELVQFKKWNDNVHKKSDIGQDLPFHRLLHNLPFPIL